MGGSRYARLFVCKYSQLVSLMVHMRADTSRCFKEEERRAALQRCVCHIPKSLSPTLREHSTSKLVEAGTGMGRGTLVYGTGDNEGRISVGGTIHILEASI